MRVRLLLISKVDEEEGLKRDIIQYMSFKVQNKGEKGVKT